MAFDQKIYNIAQLLAQHLTTRLSSATYPIPVVQKYDANDDLYLEVTVSGGATPDAIIRLKKLPAIATGTSNPVTGLAQEVYNPHIVEVGFDAGVAASGTITLNAVVAGNIVTVNGVAFTARAVAPAANEFLVGGSDTETAANLAAAINASVTAGIVGVLYASSAAAVVTVRASAPGTQGNAITLVATTAVRYVVSGATLTGGTGTGTPATDNLKVAVLCDAALAGPEMRVYEPSGIVVANLGVASLLKATYSSLEWGILDRQ
jgi:hypothetical protein